MSPTRTLLWTLGLALLLSAPAEAQRGRGHGDSDDGQGGKSGKIFGGAKVRLAPTRPVDRIDVRDVMRKVKELQVKSKAREQQRTSKAIELADEAQLRGWFTTCDHDHNGWVSFSESAQSLRFTRGRFRLFDEDRDGRLVAEEFQDFYMHSIMSAGSFTVPQRKHAGGPPPERTPEQLRAAYDTDLNGALGDLELSQLLLDYEQASADPDALLKALDGDGDGLLTLSELEGLHDILYPKRPEDVEIAPSVDGPQTVTELFGKVIPRPSETDAPPSPPRVVGPVPHFDRLDIDRDGFLTVADLETLQRPLHLGVRPHAVINTLDTDGDLKLSRAEFAAALGKIER